MFPAVDYRRTQMNAFKLIFGMYIASFCNAVAEFSGKLLWKSPISRVLSEIQVSINSTNQFSVDPKFITPIQNVTAPIGRDAVLTCVVKDLGSYKVNIQDPSWQSALITINLMMFDWIIGRLASSWNPNHIDNSKPCDHQESTCRHYLFRTQNVAAETEGYSRIGSRLLHVSNQYGSDEEPNRLFGCCGPARYRWPNNQHRFGRCRSDQCHTSLFCHRIANADNHVASGGRRTDDQWSRCSG